jgi:hypothetical protein
MKRHRGVEQTENTSDNESMKSGSAKKRKTHTRRQWEEDEIRAVEVHFKQCFIMRTLPGKAAIKQAIAQEPALSRRTWSNVKDFIRNRVNKKNK